MLGLRNPRADPVAEPAGQHSERETRQSTPENQPERAVGEIPPSETVPVRQKRTEPGHVRGDGVLQELDPHFVTQVCAAPPIVVPAHQGDAYARIDDSAELRQGGIVAAAGAPTVLEPEVEDVAVEHDPRRGFSGLVEPGGEGVFLLGGDGAEMYVRGDENGLVGVVFQHLRNYSRTGRGWKG